MKFYLAARYSRRLELCRYREDLANYGNTVTARWLNGEHQIDTAGKPIGEDGEALVEDGSTELHASMRQKFAQDDFEDVLEADTLIAFSEEPRSGHSRGGRHVEFGIALGVGIRIIAVGPHENIFFWLPQIQHFETWEEALQHITSGKAAVLAAI